MIKDGRTGQYVCDEGRKEGQDNMFVMNEGRTGQYVCDEGEKDRIICVW